MGLHMRIVTVYGIGEDVWVLYSAILIRSIDIELSNSAHVRPLLYLDTGFGTPVLGIGGGPSGQTLTNHTFITYHVDG